MCGPTPLKSLFSVNPSMCFCPRRLLSQEMHWVSTCALYRFRRSSATSNIMSLIRRAPYIFQCQSMKNGKFLICFILKRRKKKWDCLSLCLFTIHPSNIDCMYLVWLLLLCCSFVCFTFFGDVRLPCLMVAFPTCQSLDGCTNTFRKRQTLTFHFFGLLTFGIFYVFCEFCVL